MKFETNVLILVELINEGYLSKTSVILLLFICWCCFEANDTHNCRIDEHVNIGGRDYGLAKRQLLIGRV